MAFLQLWLAGACASVFHQLLTKNNREVIFKTISDAKADSNYNIGSATHFVLIVLVVFVFWIVIYGLAVLQFLIRPTKNNK